MFKLKWKYKNILQEGDCYSCDGLMYKIVRIEGVWMWLAWWNAGKQKIEVTGQGNKNSGILVSHMMEQITKAKMVRVQDHHAKSTFLADFKL